MIRKKYYCHLTLEANGKNYCEVLASLGFSGWLNHTILLAGWHKRYYQLILTNHSVRKGWLPSFYRRVDGGSEKVRWLMLHSCKAGFKSPERSSLRPRAKLLTERSSASAVWLHPLCQLSEEFLKKKKKSCALIIPRKGHREFFGVWEMWERERYRSVNHIISSDYIVSLIETTTF